MATKAEDIREELKRKSEQQINPLLKGLSMLTGGLAGEFTGTNEQIRERRQARAVLLEEQQRALQEERLSERMKAERTQMLKDRLQEIAAQNAAIAERQRAYETEKRESARPSMAGYLESRPSYQIGGERGLGGAMAAPLTALEPIESLEQQYAYEKAQQEREDQAQRLKTGYASYNIPGRGTFGGTPEQIAAMAEKDPVLKEFMSKAPPTEPPFSTSWETNPFTGLPSAKINFKGPVPYEEQKRLVEQFMGQSGANPFTGEPAPGAPSSKKKEEPTSIPGYYVRLKQ